MAVVTAIVAVGPNARMKSTTTAAAPARNRAPSFRCPAPRAMASFAWSSPSFHATDSVWIRSTPSCAFHSVWSPRTVVFCVMMKNAPATAMSPVGPMVMSQIPLGVTKPRAASRIAIPKPTTSQSADARRSTAPSSRARTTDT